MEKYNLKPAQNPIPASDRNDPEGAKTAIQLEWPESFSNRAKLVIRYLDDTAFLYSYKGRLVITDESCELTEFGSFDKEGPVGFLRWEGTSLDALEAWLEDVADEYDADGDIAGWEEEKLAFTIEMNKEYALRRINILRKHGALVKVGSQWQEPTDDLWDRAITECQEEGFHAVAYELKIPETDDSMLLAIYKDGHVSSGDEKTVIYCMTQFD